MNPWQHWASMSVLGVLLLVSPGPAGAQVRATAAAVDAEDVWFRSGDLLLHGYLYRPDGPDRFRRLSSAMVGGTREPRPAYRELAPFLVDAGYLFFAPERRGRGESPGEYVEELPMRETGTPNWSRLRAASIEVEQYDLYDALGYLRARPEVDPGRIVAAGWSTGALLSILGVEEERGLRAAIAIAVTPNLWNQSSHVRERVLEAASRATVPLLLVHTGDDVGAVSTYALAERLGASKLPHQVYIHPPAGFSAADAHPFCALHSVAVCWPAIGSFLHDVLEG